MKTMFFAAALMTGGAAIAQTDPTEPPMVREAASPETTDVAGTEYPPCDPGPGDDNCIQLYEPGVRTALAQWRAQGGARTAVGGPLEPVWDTNQNMMFEPTEFRSFGETAYTQWNTDADARLTREEFGAGWQGAGWMEPDGAFAAFDDDADGFLDGDEFFADDEFGEWDADDSGMLDDNEWGF